MEKNKTRYVVYCITNKCNGMKYIGKTHYGIKVRWNRHKNEAYKDKPTCTYLCRSIVKYGPENFDIVEIDYADNKFELIDLESRYIMEYNTLSPNGYNLKVKNENNITYSAETIEKFRRNFYDNHYEYTQTGEYKKLQSKLQQGKKRPTRSETNSKFVGVFWSKDKGRWYSKLNCNGKVFRLGYYDNELLAATAYDYAVIEYFGESGVLNFPDNLDLYKSTDPPKKRSKRKNGKFKGVFRINDGRCDGWSAVVLIETNKRKTKFFSNEKYEDSEKEAHIWRMSIIEKYNLQDES